MKTYLFVLIIVILFFSGCGKTGIAPELKNSGFESAENDRVLDWKQDAWKNEQNAVLFGISGTVVHGGSFSVYIENLVENHSRYSQTLSVTPGTSYLVTAWIKTENMVGNTCGAGIGIENIILNTAMVFDTNGEWTEKRVYLKIADDIDRIVLLLNLGNYGCVTKGKAYFDDIRITPVNSIPANESFTEIKKQQVEITPQEQPVNETSKRIKGMWLPFVLFSGFFLIVAVLLCVHIVKNKTPKTEPSSVLENQQFESGESDKPSS
jgi:hypothetical protein